MSGRKKHTDRGTGGEGDTDTEVRSARKNVAFVHSRLVDLTCHAPPRPPHARTHPLFLTAIIFPDVTEEVHLEMLTGTSP